MSAYLEHMLRLDAAGQHRDISGYIASLKGQPEMPSDVYAMLRQRRYFEAYTVARTVVAHGVYNPVLSLAQAIGGLLFGHAADMQFGVSSLATLVDRGTPEQQQFLAHEVVHPVIEQLIFSADVQDPAFALNLLEIYKGGAAEVRRIFDWTRDEQAPDPVAWQRRGFEKARLVSFSAPVSGVPRQPRKVLIAMRERVFPKKADSRLFDFGLLIGSAMGAYGWQAWHFPMKYLDLADDYRQILEQCEQRDVDVLMIDDHIISENPQHSARAAMLQRLRTLKPRMKIVAIHLDPWAVPPESLVGASEQMDALWAPHPTMPVWQHPALARKMLFMPFPLGGQCPAPTTPLPTRLTFTGAALGYNWHRVFWAAGITQGLEIEANLSMHVDDGLPPLESHARYMDRIEKAGISVNFSMRPNMSRVLTARAFESIMAGALLVQEETDEIHAYFIAGEHYLSFDTARDLRAVTRFIRERPQEAEAIRRRGNAFARDRYSDEKIIGYLDKALFHSESAARAA